MTTEEIAHQLVSICRKGDFEPAQKELFSEDAVSLEPHSSEAFQKETKGLPAILEKGKKWNEMVKEVHHMEVSDAVIAGNSFACSMRLHVTMKEGGDMDVKELCVYKVKDGKIISEEFFM
jgi:ketosteroid isomerase-like protein